MGVPYGGGRGGSIVQYARVHGVQGRRFCGDGGRPVPDGVVGRGTGDGGDGVPQHTTECRLPISGARGELEPRRRPVAPLRTDGVVLQPDAAAGLRIIGLYAETSRQVVGQQVDARNDSPFPAHLLQGRHRKPTNQRNPILGGTAGLSAADAVLRTHLRAKPRGGAQPRVLCRADAHHGAPPLQGLQKRDGAHPQRDYRRLCGGRHPAHAAYHRTDLPAVSRPLHFPRPVGLRPILQTPHRPLPD